MSLTVCSLFAFAEERGLYIVVKPKSRMVTNLNIIFVILIPYKIFILTKIAKVVGRRKMSKKMGNSSVNE